MDLDVSKNLGGIGAILLVIGVLGVLGTVYAGVLSLVGIILVLIAMKGLADYYNEGGIFNNALYGFLTTIVGGVASVAVIVISVILALTTLITDWTNPTEWETLFQDFTNLSALWTLLGSIIAALIIVFIFAIITALFYRKSFNLLAAKSGVNMFSTAGLLLLIGAVLTIILVGFIIIWIAFILLAVGFFSIKTTTTQPPPVASPTPQS